VHIREHGKRYLLFAQPAVDEEAKSAPPQQRGALTQFKLIKFTDASTPTLVKTFKFHIKPAEDYLHFDLGLNFMLHV
jgi:hypothetical protein